MSTGLHIYRASDQPATRYVVDVSEGIKPFTIRNSPKRCLYAMCCRRRRVAANLIAHVYYDATMFFCRQDKGCKGERERTRKAAREWRNRSRAMKAAWARRRAQSASTAAMRSPSQRITGTGMEFPKAL
ncbi:MAG TPA: hypothetical protein VI229_00100 [Burkholderiales bacterium]